MKVAPIPHNESDRLRAVRSLGINVENTEKRFDRITQIAQLVFNISTVFMTLVTKDRILIFSRQGSNLVNEPRKVSFCGHTICNEVTSNMESRIFEVKDTITDSRFKDNPYVTAIPATRYYIGCVLQSLDRKNVGTLCMTDIRPRHLTSAEKRIFSKLGKIAESEINRNTKFLDDKLKIKKIIELANQGKGAVDGVDMLFGVTDLTNELIQSLDEHLQKREITLKEWRVLNEIVCANNITPTAVSLKTKISPPMVSRLLASLESKKLIERIYIRGEDRRKVSVNCTGIGKDVWLYGKTYAIELGDIFMRTPKRIF